MCTCFAYVCNISHSPSFPILSILYGVVPDYACSSALYYNHWEIESRACFDRPSATTGTKCVIVIIVFILFISFLVLFFIILVVITVLFLILILFCILVIVIIVFLFFIVVIVFVLFVLLLIFILAISV